MKLAGYRLEKAIRRGDGRVTFRAVRETDGARVCIETLDTEYPGRQQAAELARAGTLAQRLSEVPGVIAVHAVERHGSGNLALITEACSRSLADLLVDAGGKGLPPAQVLGHAIALVRILAGIHARGVVHKALTPAQVMFAEGDGGLRLCGFGIASELLRESSTSSSPRRLEGPLPYLSPEQTGRMNRALDYRSDYYSLGIGLFELLTGRKPFEADHALGWVHCHISRQPPVPHELDPAIPPAVSAIVLKLLAKDPEARYQSADALLGDLERCRAALAAGLALNDFSPGEGDVPLHFLVPQNLYGRQRETAQLLGLFEAAAAGGAVFCLVHGYSGVGKSALVSQLDRPLVRERGFFVQGKFDQLQRGEAFSALAAALRGLVHQALAEPPAQLEAWRLALLEALGPNAQLIVERVPELELIVGPQPVVAALPPAEARNRLQIVLTAFIRVFAAAGYPLVIFLDDLQWSDVPTLELIKRLVSGRELGHLLLIGTYRSNEIGPGHPLRLMLEELASVRAVEEIPLRPLDRDAVADLVADALRTERPLARELGELLYDKAGGNPFFTTELLKRLHEDGAISLPAGGECWVCDLHAVRWSGLSNDVVEFMVDNLRQLPPATQELLELAACIGNTFDLRTLAVIHERSPAETAAVLLAALKRHVVVPLHASYRLVGESPELNPSYRFLHDRVQQAAYALIPPQRLQAVHCSIGRLMLRHADAEEREARLIDIVGHLNAGRALIDDPAERLTLAQLNLSAGIRARHAAAYEAAMDYLQTGEALLPADAVEAETGVARALAAELQQCAYLTGRHAEAEARSEALLRQARDDLERAEILVVRTRQYATLGRMDASIQAAIRGLALLGVVFVDDPDDAAIAEERRLVLVNLGGRAVAELVDAPPERDPATLTAMRLLMEIFAAAFLSGSGNLFPYLVLKAVNLSLRHGNCPESAFAYAAYGMLLCGELDEPALGHEYGKVGLAINERLDDIALRARVIYVYAMFVHHWSEHWSSLTPLFRKGIESGYQSGDLLYLAYSAQDCVIWDPTLDLETAAARHAENLEIVRECAYQDSFDSGSLFLQLQRNLLGLTDAPDSLSDAGFDEHACLAGIRRRGFMTGIANYLIYKAEACFMHGLTVQALGYVEEQDGLIRSAMSLPQLVRFYIVAFLVRASLYPDMPAATQAATLERLQRDFDRMGRWAANCPANFAHLHLLMRAELARLAGHGEAALDAYEAAIDAARRSGFLRDEAVACERAARHLLAGGRGRAAEGYLRAAYLLYARWGAQRKLGLLMREFPVLAELLTDRRPAAGGLSGGELDLASLMKASRVISGEMVLDRLMRTTMDIVLENAGGQWGCLVVCRDGQLTVEAFSASGGAEAGEAEGLPPQACIADAQGRRFGLPVTVIWQVLRSHKAVVLDDAAGAGDFTGDPYVSRRRPASILCVPIGRERFDGVVYIENRLATGAFPAERVEIVHLLAAQAVVAIDNARLYEQVQEYSRTLEQRVAERTARLAQLNVELQALADRDGLTGVANRRRGDLYLAETWARLQREQAPVSLVLFDVDHFKAYNDGFGHQKGDECLAAVAAAARREVPRAQDMLARYGGEEFMIVLPDTDIDGAALVAERVRKAVAALGIAHVQAAGGRVTISAGVATLIPIAGNTIAGLVHQADLALYEAKRAGRNQVCRAS